jgi:hypothetical protein
MARLLFDIPRLVSTAIDIPPRSRSKLAVNKERRPEGGKHNISIGEILLRLSERKSANAISAA